MSVASARKIWTIDEFVAWEEEQPGRHECLFGRARAMVGGTLDHHQITLNLGAALKERLRGRGCRAFVEGAKLRTDEAVTYPDVVATCAPVDGRDRALTDAALVVEVLSPSTAGIDHGAKWLIYQKLPSLAAYLLVEQDARRVHLYTRAGVGRWEYRTIEEAEGVVALGEPFGALDFATIYDDTSLARPA